MLKCKECGIIVSKEKTNFKNPRIMCSDCYLRSYSPPEKPSKRLLDSTQYDCKGQKGGS